VKLLSTWLAFALGDRQLQRNLRSLAKYVVVLGVVIAVYAVLFHVIMEYAEGRRHSWLTGVYWTLTVMSTLGFGDITFHSDLGRAFSIVVLLSGIVLLLIVLPFAFIRYFYAPWLEARLRLRAPREVSDETCGHVIFCTWDSIAVGLSEELTALGVPWVLIEPDPTRAAQLHGEGVPVVAGEVDSAETYQRAGVSRARAVLANCDEVTNTNITLTVREVSATVPVLAVVENGRSVDILELSGATKVLPLKLQLGEQLASRVNAGRAQAHVIGNFRNLLIAEVPVHNTPLAGKSLRDSKLRDICGVNAVAVWESAQLVPAHPDLVLNPSTVPVVVGTPEMIAALDEFLCIYDANYNPVLVIGGGRVGRAVARALKNRGVAFNLVEKREEMRPRLEGWADRLVMGDAARREVLDEAGLAEAPSVVITTSDDAVNLYLCIYCRRLNPEARIVCRITHQRNIASMQRAGADLTLSYARLGVEAVLAELQGRELVFLGGGVELITAQVPPALAGQSLAQAGIGARFGLNVLAVDAGTGGQLTPAGPATLLPKGGEVFMLGSADAYRAFRAAFA
jgi:Trk K+ transport system NAD-binding subunit